MAGKQVTREEIARRQEFVARLLGRRVPAEKIAEAVARLGLPASLRTIQRDILELREAAQSRALAAADELLGDELLQLEEIATAAAEQYAQSKDPRFLSEWRQTLARKAALLGLDAEIRAKVANPAPAGSEADPVHYRVTVEYVNDWRGVRAGG